MRILEALEGKGCRIPLTKGEAELIEKLAAITRQVKFIVLCHGVIFYLLVEVKLIVKKLLQLKGSGAELSRRVQNLLNVSRIQANSGGYGGSVCLPGSTKIQDQSLTNLQEVWKFRCSISNISIKKVKQKLQLFSFPCSSY